MATQVEKTVEVDVPVNTAYNQWTQFEEFPQFMSGVDEVRQVGEALTHWVAQIAGVRREWDAAILEQVPDSKVAWAATTGATNAGAVFFQSLGPARTLVRLQLEYEPEGLVEKVGDFLNVVSRQAEGDLERFKAFIEGRGAATGGWRGAVNEAGTVGSPGVDAASASRGDSGKAGVSGTAVAAGVAAAGVAAAGVAAATAAKRSGEGESTSVGESDMSGDVIAVGPTGGTESTLQTTPPVEPGVTALDSDRAFDDDPGPSDRLDGDVLAVDEFGTATAGVNGGTIGLPVEPTSAGGAGDELDPDGPRTGTFDDSNNPRRGV
ncbi:SRPBCC family protein [Pseudonocardia charpentierae]|uniref:SRPBCC family protein n=1 Tax=Pseudonocardia charpentierae TaxID=3075545 RepID=A0ABU2N5D8_9PSEU|nr:SRPBCC family protein [Pseudonocardia sp. DSM 45834]MDT0349099.1 SRPBCC family protein [Pseudonocardia sp. DSM 45834]